MTLCIKKPLELSSFMYILYLVNLVEKTLVKS